MLHCELARILWWRYLALLDLNGLCRSVWGSCWQIPCGGHNSGVWKSDWLNAMRCIWHEMTMTKKAVLFNDLYAWLNVCTSCQISNLLEFKEFCFFLLLVRWAYLSFFFCMYLDLCILSWRIICLSHACCCRVLYTSNKICALPII